MPAVAEIVLVTRGSNGADARLPAHGSQTRLFATRICVTAANGAVRHAHPNKGTPAGAPASTGSPRDFGPSTSRHSCSVYNQAEIRRL
jgi:hypothetical protein